MFIWSVWRNKNWQSNFNLSVKRVSDQVVLIVPMSHWRCASECESQLGFIYVYMYIYYIYNCLQKNLSPWYISVHTYRPLSRLWECSQTGVQNNKIVLQKWTFPLFCPPVWLHSHRCERGLYGVHCGKVLIVTNFPPGAQNNHNM